MINCKGKISINYWHNWVACGVVSITSFTSFTSYNLNGFTLVGPFGPSQFPLTTYSVATGI